MRMKKNATKSLFEGMDQAELPPGCVIRAAVDTGADSEFDYLLPETMGSVVEGQRVEVPFGKNNKLIPAFVLRVVSDAEEICKTRQFCLKEVRKILDAAPLLDSQLMSLARWIAEYYVCPLGQVLASIIPAAVKKDAGAKTEQFIYLSSESVHAGIDIKSKKQRAILDILQTLEAFDESRGVEKKSLLRQGQCGPVPLKQLIRNGLVCAAARRVIGALPAIPPALMLGSKSVILNAGQQAAVEHLIAQLQSNTFGVTLLHGVTDSGKTEVYIRAIEVCLRKGKQAIVLLPEIALTAQMVERFRQRFEKVAVLHSGLNHSQRNAQWQMIKSGDADVVIGARSAIFAPLSNIGLIVVDEEHESSYKQDTVPRYHGRDVAIKRAHLASAHCLLGSATPSLETLSNCRTKPFYTLMELPERVTGMPMPEMKLVDMTSAFQGTGRKSPHILSPVLIEQLKKTLDKGQQAILLLNRRGYSNFIYCPSCHHTLHCMNCDVTLTFHKRPHLEKAEDTAVGTHIQGGYAICHYCLSKTLVPKKCPLCHHPMTMIGLGSQRLEEELLACLPQARIKRVDSDSMNGQDYYSVLDDFASGKIDILTGTQMLAKGLHFPNVTLVGIVSADTALTLPDFRANERTFQLISQVAGRAGRGDKPGLVIVQTFLPDAPVIQYALHYDFQGFVKEELEHRKMCFLPPFWRMAIIHIKDTVYERLETGSKVLKERLEATVQRLGLEIKLRGPMPATISRIQRFHRFQIILQAPRAGDLQRLFADLRVQAPIRPAVQIYYDVDPIHVL
ncbi:MAG: primosomal protein N' [Sedimentisphaerales bacterium]|nr:primosomal protein N' [Sedimentisphaerales bacterium]